MMLSFVSTLFILFFQIRKANNKCFTYINGMLCEYYVCC